MSPSPTNRLRGVARRAREAVAPDGTSGSADVDRLLGSGLFDPWYYGLQTRTEMAPHDAVDHWMREGAAAGLLPNPLTDVDATGLVPDEVVAAMLDGSAAAFPVRAGLDVAALVDLAPQAVEHPGGPVGFYLQHAHAGAPVPMLGKRSWRQFSRLRQQQSDAMEAVLASGILDREYYAAQTRRTFVDDREAVWHFLETGESQALTPSPLYERAWYRSKAGVRMPMTLMHLLRTGQVEGAAGPHFDGVTYLERVPAASEHPGGPLGHFLVHADESTPTVPEPGSGVEPVPWGAFRAHMLAAARRLTLPTVDAVDWHAIDEGLQGRVEGRVSVLVVADGDRHRTRRAVDHVLDRGDADVEVLVVDNGSDREIASILTACWAGDPRVRVDRLPEVSHVAVAANRALAASTGEIVVLLEPDTEVHPGWLAPLLEAVSRPDVLAAQPLLLTADDTIRSAGLVSAGTHVVPVHLLASHPVDDLPGGDVLVPDAVSSACLVVRADVLVGVRGLDEAFGDLADVDLSLRLAEAHPGTFATATASRVSRRARTPLPAPAEDDQLLLLERWGGRLPAARTEHWERAGFQVDGVRPGAGLPVSGRRTTSVPVLTRPPRVVRGGPAAGMPSLRWAVKIAAQGGPRGDEWGDTYFADDLVRGLRHWGQEAFVDRRGAHERPGVDHLDDVTLTLRGRWPAVAQPGATNVLWVISHPDEVPLDELAQGFDLVYSAGRGWAEQVSTASQEVRTLLQATDPARFTPDGDTMDGLGTLFVGRTRKVMRPVVGDAVAVGADLTVFGDGWEEFIDPAHVGSDHLANELVPSAYRGARIVLNDHWTDMARLGFYSNRLFDAVASGARVVSDPVDGLQDVLGPSVQTYRTQDELRSLLAPDSSAWPDDAVIAANAARVAAEHSFAARAKVLLDDVLATRDPTMRGVTRGE